MFLFVEPLGSFSTTDRLRQNQAASDVLKFGDIEKRNFYANFKGSP